LPSPEPGFYKDRASRITIPQSIAWRLFTKGIDPESARDKVSLAGDIALAKHVLRLVAIVD
jgi:hypothetical protein